MELNQIELIWQGATSSHGTHQHVGHFKWHALNLLPTSLSTLPKMAMIERQTITPYLMFAIYCLAVC